MTPPSHGVPRIYDTFQFDSELDLLEHRLRETFDLIDRFVLIEAAETFRGSAKPLCYAENRTRFRWARDKISHVALKKLNGSSAWEREAFQRNATMLGLLDAKPHDIILLLDADEILSRTFLERLRRTGLERPHRLAMTRHYEYVDQLAPASPCCPPRSASFPFDAHRIRPGAWTELDERWSGRSGIAVRFCDLSGDESRVLPARSPYEFRRGAAHAPLIEDAGRHLSCVDRSARLERKLEWFPHLELADARARSLPFLALARQNGIHHHGWWYAEQPTGSLPDDLLRLSRNVPAMMRADPVPGSFRRRLVRTWAWLRFWPALPDGLVAAVDRHFGVLLPFLTPALLAADCLRVIAARFRWRWLSRLSAEPDIRGHG